MELTICKIISDLAKSNIQDIHIRLVRMLQS